MLNIKSLCLISICLILLIQPVYADTTFFENQDDSFIMNEFPSSSEEDNSNSEESSTGGGGYPIYYLSESDLQEGYSKDLGENWKLRFNFENETYELKLNEIQNNSVTIEISSNPITFNLSINKTKKIDLNDNGFYDVSVLLKNITGNPYYHRAEIYIKSINEKIQNQSNITKEENYLKDKEDKSNYILTGITLIAIIIISLIFIFKLKKKKFFKKK